MKEAIKTGSVFGILIAFVAIFRNSEYMAFLDEYTFEEYYVTQLLFMFLLVGLVAYLVAKFAQGQMTLRELTEAAKELSEIPELDKKTAKRRKGEVVFMTHLVDSDYFETGSPLNVENSLNRIDYSQLSKDVRKSEITRYVIVGIVLIFCILMLVYFDFMYAIFLRL